MGDLLLGAGLVWLILFVVTIFLWRWLAMWFFGVREILKELRGLRQDVANMRAFSSTPTYQQPTAAPYTPALPAPPRASTPTTYTPPTYNPAEMSATPPPGWTGAWDPNMFGKK